MVQFLAPPRGPGVVVVVLPLLPQNGVKSAYKMESPWQRVSWKTVRLYGHPNVSSVISTHLTSPGFFSDLKLVLPVPGPLHALCPVGCTSPFRMKPAFLAVLSPSLDLATSGDVSVP